MDNEGGMILWGQPARTKTPGDTGETRHRRGCAYGVHGVQGEGAVLVCVKMCVCVLQCRAFVLLNNDLGGPLSTIRIFARSSTKMV